MYCLVGAGKRELANFWASFSWKAAVQKNGAMQESHGCDVEEGVTRWVLATSGTVPLCAGSSSSGDADSRDGPLCPERRLWSLPAPAPVLRVFPTTCCPAAFGCQSSCPPKGAAVDEHVWVSCAEDGVGDPVGSRG